MLNHTHTLTAKQISKMCPGMYPRVSRFTRVESTEGGVGNGKRKDDDRTGEKDQKWNILNFQRLIFSIVQITVTILASAGQLILRRFEGSLIQPRQIHLAAYITNCTVRTLFDFSVGRSGESNTTTITRKCKCIHNDVYINRILDL